MAANTNHAFGYGDDPWTEEATRKVKEQFTHPCEPLFVFNGTGSNTMALQLMTRPYHVIFCADTVERQARRPDASCALSPLPMEN